MSRSALVLVASLLVCGSAMAAPSGPDRSTLSYEENVLINTVCASARPKGDVAYYDCVSKQVAALQAHPSPDRSGLTQAQNRAIEERCRYLRRSGVAAYYDCISQAIAGPTTSTSEDAEMQATPVVVTNVPLPASVLPKRPENVHKQALPPEQLFKTLERSVYVVAATPSVADARARNVMQGSAVAVSEHLLLTNCHVVKGRELIKIVQDHTVSDAKLIAADSSADRCVLRADDVTLVPITGVRAFGDLAVGEHVFAIGAPRGLERTLSEGLLSGLRHQPGRNLVQTSAAISPGSSGGGLFDERGNLIGITTMQLIGVAQNLNFAVAAGDYWN